MKLRKDYENIIRSLNAEIKKLQQERDGFSFSRKKITQQWMDWGISKKNMKKKSKS